MDDKKIFLSKASPEFQKTIESVMSVVESIDPNLQGRIKWGNFTYALNGDFHHWICAVSTTKKAVNLIFHFGGLLEDRKRIMISGTSKFFRKIEFRTMEDVNKELITDLVTQAINKLDYFKKNWKEINKTK